LEVLTNNPYQSLCKESPRRALLEQNLKFNIMKKVIIVKKGQSTVGPWFLINEPIGDFNVAKFLHPKKELFDKVTEGQEIEVPVQVLA
jgi:hypothetical protein